MSVKPVAQEETLNSQSSLVQKKSEGKRNKPHSEQLKKGLLTFHENDNDNENGNEEAEAEDGHENKNNWK